MRLRRDSTEFVYFVHPSRLHPFLPIIREGRAVDVRARAHALRFADINIAHGGVMSLILCPSFEHEIPLFKAHCPPYFSFGVGTYADVFSHYNVGHIYIHYNAEAG